MKKIFFAGELPYVLVLLIAATSFYFGRLSINPYLKLATAEKGAVILEAMMSNPTRSKEQIESQIRQPLLKLLEHYQNAGYLVVDVTKDEQGFMSISAVPSDAIDITSEMKAALKKANPNESNASDKPN